MVGIDHQRQLGCPADPVGLVCKFAEGEHDEVGCAEHGQGRHRAGKHPCLEAQVRGNPRRNRIMHRGWMDAGGALQKCAKPLAALSPTRWHGILRLGSVELLLYHPARLCFIRVRGHATQARFRGTGMNEDLQYAVLHEFVEPARRNLSQGSWDYLMGGAETETTLERNRARARRHRLPSARAAQRREGEHARQGAGPGCAPAGHSGADRLAAGFLARRRRGPDQGGRRVRRAAHAELGLRARSRGRRRRPSTIPRSTSSTSAATRPGSRITSRARSPASTSRCASPSISTTTAAASATSPSATSPLRAAATRRTISRPALPGPTSRV